VLRVVNQAFPKAGLGEKDVLSTWSGLRPLVANSSGKPSDISRRHSVSMSQPGWWDITGVKLTTYRLMAEETVESIGKYLALKMPECQTAEKPLLNGQDTSEISGILPPSVSAELVRHFCQQEWAQHLEDVMLRRTSWRHYHRDHQAVAEQVAGWMADELSWTEEQLRQELDRYRALCGERTVPQPHFALDSQFQKQHEREAAKHR